MKSHLLIFAIFILSFSGFAQSIYWITPTNGHQQINSISFYNSTDGLAVCDDGVILKYSDGIWSKMQSPITSNLMDVEMLSLNYALACGNDGVVLSFNGNTWTKHTTPDYRQLTDITVISENNAYAAGNGGILYYNGSNWTDTGIEDDIQCIDFMDANEGWAVGYDMEPVFWHFHNGTWIKDSSLHVNELIFFDDVTIIDAQHAKLTGHTLEGEGVLYEYNGTEWQQTGTAPNSGSSFTDENTGFGISNRIGPWLDEYPAIFKFSNDLWTEEYTGLYNERLTSINSISDNEAFVSTDEGFVYNGLNGDWKMTNGFTADQIMDISLSADNNIYFACGSEGIWHYYAGNWTHELIVPGFTFNVIESMDWEVWASGYKETEIPSVYEVRIYKKIQNGWEMWTSPYEIISPVTSLTYMMTYTSANQINIIDGTTNQQILLPSNDSITSFGQVTIIVNSDDVKFPSVYFGFITTKRTNGELKGAIYSNVFTDQWELSYETTTAQFNDVKSFRYGFEAYAVGNNGLMAYYNGTQWTELPQLTSEDLLSLNFDTQNRGWAVGRNGTILYFNEAEWSLMPSLTDKDLLCTGTPLFPFDGNLFLLGGTDGTLLANLPSIPTNSKDIEFSFDNTVSIFPNPSNNEISVTVSPKHSKSITFEIIDLSGKILQSGVLELTGESLTGKLHVEKLSVGTYLVRVTSANLVQTGKLIIL